MCITSNISASHPRFLLASRSGLCTTHQTANTRTPTHPADSPTIVTTIHIPTDIGCLWLVVGRIVFNWLCTSRAWEGCGMTFRVGQKVVCINASGGFKDRSGRIHDTNELTLNRVYTVRWAGEHNGQPCVRLAEVFRRGVPQFEYDKPPSDRPWFASRFRPLIERQTDISFAHEILRKVSKKQGASA